MTHFDETHFDETQFDETHFNETHLMRNSDGLRRTLMTCNHL